MTPRVCRTARAALGLNQRALAREANVSTQTLADFERGARTPHPNNIASIERVFEKNGIKFIRDNGNIIGMMFG